jgi:hypothetical protein
LALDRQGSANKMLDPETFEKAVTALENDPVFVRLMVEGTRFSGPEPTGLDDLGYSLIIMKAVMRAWEITGKIFASDNTMDQAKVFHEASLRIVKKYNLAARQ